MYGKNHYNIVISLQLIKVMGGGINNCSNQKKKRKSSPLEKPCGKESITIFNMVQEGKIFPAVQTIVKGQLNTIIAVDSKC